jgi:uncharacterized protein YciI
MTVYPRHKIVVDEFVARGDVVGIGPFADGGNLAIFRSREAAEQFVERDPFIREGLVAAVTLHEWGDTMLA